tara:strand:- start:4505 stop:4942 length:438 start_codon:yes stop_codon:yes gene_type:complete
MKVEVGQNVSVHYMGTLEDGTEFDNSRTKGTPLDFTVGSGQLIPGFDSAVVGMGVGEVKSIKVAPGEAYGDFIPEAIVSVPKSQFPEGFQFEVGAVVHGKNPDGSIAAATIASQDGFTVTLDCNHPLAGKNLNFEIEVVSINENQ